MKTIFDKKKQVAKIRIDSADELWHLTQILQPGDSITGKTYRKIKISEEEEKSRVKKKPITVTIKSDKFEFEGETLRINGTILSGPEDVPLGSAQNITLHPGEEITIQKKWMKYQLKQLKELEKKRKEILLIIFDRDEALVARSTNIGRKILAKIKGEATKKEERAQTKGNWYKKVAELIKEYSTKYKKDYVVVASPTFYKQELMKEIDNELKRKIIISKCSSTNESAINEVLKNEATKKAIIENTTIEETDLIEKILKLISKNGNVSYGYKEVKKAAESGAIKILLITQKTLRKLREKKNLEELFEQVEKNKGEIRIISSEHEAGKKLEGLTGIAATLRYKLK